MFTKSQQYRWTDQAFSSMIPTYDLKKKYKLLTTISTKQLEHNELD